MTEIDRDITASADGPSGTTEAAASSPKRSSSGKTRVDGLIAWAVISIGLLAFIGFGSVDARIWRFRNLRIEPRSILRVWTLQAETLPRVSHQWLMTTLFYGCLIVIVASTLVGIWFLLDSAGTGSAKPAPDSEPDSDTA